MGEPESAASVPQAPAGLIPRLLLIAFVAELAYATLNISTMPVYLAYDRHIGPSLIGVILIAYLLVEAIFKGPMGMLADRVGRKRLIVAGPLLTAFTAFGTVLAARLAPPYETYGLILLRAVDGLGAAMLWPAVFALAGDATPDRFRQRTMSWLNMGYLGGIALALPAGGWFNDTFGPGLAQSTGARSPGLFLASALFLAAALLAGFLLPRHEPAHRPEAGADELTPVGLFGAARRIPGYLALAFVVFLGVGFPMVVVKLFAEEQLGLSESQFGALVLPAALAMAVLSMPATRFAERLGRAKAVHAGLALSVAGLLAFCGGAVLPWMRNPVVAMLALAPVGLGFLVVLPAWMASVSDIDPRRRAVHLGAVMAAQGLGAIVGAPVGAALYEHLPGFFGRIHLGEALGRYSPFIGSALMLFFAWLISMRLLRDFRPTM